jgi:hypothetical protein
MPLDPMLILKQMEADRRACFVQKSECGDFAEKFAYFVPPVSVVSLNKGIRISSVDAVIGMIYFDAPIPPDVKEGWVMIVRDCFIVDMPTYEDFIKSGS